MRLVRLSSLVAVSLLAVSPFGGCGSSANSSEPDGATPTSDAAPSEDLGSSDAAPSEDLGGDAGPEGDWVELVGGAWSLGAGSEGYECVLITIPEETYLKGIRQIAPEGTHHTVVSIANPGTEVGPDRQFSCDGFTNGPHMIYASGVGTAPLLFPEGVAVRLEAGTKLLLNLHLFNYDPASGLSGRSAVEVLYADPTEVVNEAEVVLAGKDEGLVVAARRTSTQTGRCTFTREQSIFAVMPHMHLTGSAMRVTATRSGMPDFDLYDDFYDFDRQAYRNVRPEVAMPAGSRLTVECTYDNPGDARAFGESSNDEMCYAAVYRYPASGASVTCTN